MTTAPALDPSTDDAERPGRQLWLVDVGAPPERLAMFRILAGVFTVAYLLIRFPVFVQLGDRERGFEGVGVASLLDGPVSSWVVVAVLLGTVAAGVAATVGAFHRVTGVAFAVGMLALSSYRSSWGQLLHFEHLFVLHLLVLAFAPAADAWSLDARRRAPVERSPESYGFPLALAAWIVVLTYVIAGVAKLRYGGLDWVIGDTLRNHVAYSAARLDVLGGTPSPVAGPVVGIGGVWPVAAAATVLIELAAPVALLGGKWRTGWVAAAWAMHAGILVFMLVGFPYPLFLVAFAPFYRIERLWTDRPSWLRSDDRRLSAR